LKASLDGAMVDSRMAMKCTFSIVIAGSEATKQSGLRAAPWIASRSLSSGAHFARPVGSQ
jgi:hypothetical protein